MSVTQLIALGRRHIYAVCLIALVTVGFAADFKLTPAVYKETATVVVEPQFFAETRPVDINSLYAQDTSLIQTCLLLVMHLSDPAGTDQFRQAGVTGTVAIAVVNSYDQDSPTYNGPDISVSLTGTDPSVISTQFGTVLRVIAKDIDQFQAPAKIPASSRLMTYTLSDGNPVSQRGSLVRSYAALLILFLIAAYLASRYLDYRGRTRAAPAAA